MAYFPVMGLPAILGYNDHQNTSFTVCHLPCNCYSCGLVRDIDFSIYQKRVLKNYILKTILSKHSTKLSKIILLTGALVYFAFGFVFFIYPDIITTMDGIVLPDRPAANHIRAVYGGMEIGLGMLLIYFCFAKGGLRNGLIVLAFSIGLTSLSRLYGIVFDGGGDMSNWLSFGAEFAFGVGAFVCYKIEKKRIELQLHPKQFY